MSIHSRRRTRRRESSPTTEIRNFPMSIYNIVNSSRRSHEGRGLFVLGSSAEANAAVARAMKAAGVPKSYVLKVHIPSPPTARALVRCISEMAGLMMHPHMTLSHMTERCLHAIRGKRILHIDGPYSAGDQLRPKLDAQLYDHLLLSIMRNEGISLVINGPRRPKFGGSGELIRRFRFLSAAHEVTPDDGDYLIGGV
jgi:hypothetical protein